MKSVRLAFAMGVKWRFCVVGRFGDVERLGVVLRGETSVAAVLGVLGCSSLLLAPGPHTLVSRNGQRSAGGLFGDSLLGCALALFLLDIAGDSCVEAIQ